ncbi:hypothetical protein G5574_18810 [Pantoea stewartii]|nr:hypothetical protein G5574_18810 [Pantoea stewartii]
MAGWQPYKTVTLDGYNNTIPGGSFYNETNVASGVYRFRIDPESAGVDYATGQAGNTRSKSAALMIYDRTTTSDKSAALMIYDRTTTSDKSAAVSFYGLNDDGLEASSLMHAFPQGGGFDLYLQDWQRADNSGSLSVIIEKWQN